MRRGDWPAQFAKGAMSGMDELREFDAAEYLEDEEDITLYLAATVEEDLSLLPKALGVVARARGMGELARTTGLSRETLYKTLSEDGNPTISTLKKILDAYGVRISIAQT